MISVLPTRARFLCYLWKYHSDGTWLFLAAKRGNDWHEFPIQNDGNIRKNVRSFFRSFPASKYDLYFCPNAFRLPNRNAETALCTPYAWCDIDEANPYHFVPTPGAIWETSPGRFQGLWFFNKSLNPRQAERISKYLTYEFDGDNSGWSVTKYLRIPGTYNHKREGKPPRVKVLQFDLSKIDPAPLLATAPKLRKASHQGKRLKASEFHLYRNPTALFKKYRKQIRHRKAKALLRHKTARELDRSRQIFTIIAALVNARVPWGDIACLVWHSPYFQSKHDNNITALEAEIQRAMNKLDTGDDQ